MLVSELEKKAEIRIKAASSVKSSPSGASFKGGIQSKVRFSMLEKNSAADKHLAAADSFVT
jgi:hypothetical protein